MQNVAYPQGAGSDVFIYTKAWPILGSKFKFSMFWGISREMNIFYKDFVDIFFFFFFFLGGGSFLNWISCSHAPSLL